MKTHGTAKREAHALGSKNPIVSVRQTGRFKVRGADFVMYQVSNLEEAARFYREVLGLRQDVYSEEWQWAEFDCGNVTLSLKGGAKPVGGVGGARIALAVDDIHAACKELKKKGVLVASEPQDYEVCWSMEVFDPDGNIVLLHQRADGTCGAG